MLCGSFSPGLPSAPRASSFLGQWVPSLSRGTAISQTRDKVGNRGLKRVSIHGLPSGQGWLLPHHPAGSAFGKRLCPPLARIPASCALSAAPAAAPSAYPPLVRACPRPPASRVSPWGHATSPDPQPLSTGWRHLPPSWGPVADRRVGACSWGPWVRSAPGEGSCRAGPGRCPPKLIVPCGTRGPALKGSTPPRPNGAPRSLYSITF